MTLAPITKAPFNRQRWLRAAGRWHRAPLISSAFVFLGVNLILGITSYSGLRTAADYYAEGEELTSLERSAVWGGVLSFLIYSNTIVVPGTALWFILIWLIGGGSRFVSTVCIQTKLKELEAQVLATKEDEVEALTDEQLTALNHVLTVVNIRETTDDTDVISAFEALRNAVNQKLFPTEA